MGVAADDPGVGPVHGAVGVTENVARYSSGYGQPETVVTPPRVSDASYQPLKPFVTLLGIEVNVGTGSVMIVAVSV